VDKQGLTGRKREFTSIPYKSITYFAMESAGTLDRDGEIKLWVKGSSTPVTYEIHKNISIEDLCRTLSLYVLQ
jgi:Bacterial PH domain